MALAWLALDQLTKLAVLQAFSPPGSQRRVLLPGWLDLTLTHNPGAAFGLLNDVAWARVLFIAVGLIALGAIVALRRSILRLPWPQRLGLALVAGGAAGNLIDRLFRDGLVVDFIRFHIDAIGFVWPDFNVADIGVTCGMLLYVVHALVCDFLQHGCRDGEQAAASATAPDAQGDAA